MKSLGLTPTSPAWAEHRRKCITASDVAAILGESRWQSPYGVWARITGRIPADEVDSEAAEAGVRLEQAVADWWSDKSKRTLAPSPGLVQHDTLDYFVGTPDRLILSTGATPTPEGVYEGKTTGLHRQAEWDEGPPQEARMQLHSYLVLSGLSLGAVAALIGGQKMRWAWVTAEPALSALILESVQRFWQEHVQPDIPPPVSGLDHDKEVLARLFPKDDGSTVVFSPEESDMVHKHNDLHNRIVALELEKQELGNKLRARLGDATYGVGASCRVTWKLEKRRYKAREASESEGRVLRCFTK